MRLPPFAATAALVLAVLGLQGCAPDPGGVPATSRPTLVVYAAMSTRDALVELQPDLQRELEVTLVFQFGSSGDLARQIEAAPKADVFLSAGVVEMDRLASAHLLALESRRDLLSNQLVVIEPSDVPSIFTQPFTAAQLTDPRVNRLSLAHVETVPAGRYARAWLEREGLWKDLEPKVLPAVDVRAALSVVTSGAAEAGIVYRSDAALTHGARIVYFVPRDALPRIVYPIAAITGREHEALARRFIGRLISATSRPVFERFGFEFAE